MSLVHNESFAPPSPTEPAAITEEVRSFESWTQRFATQDACLDVIAKHRWNNGFKCPKCNHDKAWILQRHRIRHCQRCGFQASPTAGTMFENTRLPLPKWFVAIYLLEAKNGKLPAEQLRKRINVTWRTARLMLNKLRRAKVTGELGELIGSHLTHIPADGFDSSAIENMVVKKVTPTVSPGRDSSFVPRTPNDEKPSLSESRGPLANFRRFLIEKLQRYEQANSRE